VRDFEIYGSCYYSEAMRGRLTEFDQFLANYPWITEKLRKKPSEANDQDSLHDNPEPRDYPSLRPVLQREFRSNPRRVINRAYAPLLRRLQRRSCENLVYWAGADRVLFPPTTRRRIRGSGRTSVSDALHLLRCETVKRGP